MPLVVYALGAYVVGLYAGFSGSPPFMVAAVAAAFAIGWRRARPAGIGLVALTVAGVVIARADAHVYQACGKRAERSDSLRVVVADAIGPGGFTRGRLSGCDARIAISADQGSADGGSTIIARGT